MSRPDCPYCKAKAMRTTGATIYPHRLDLADKVFYWCPPCEAYVGTHAMTGEPLGALANAKLRKLRNAAHAAFDPIWQEPARKAACGTKNLRRKFPKPFNYFVPQFRTAAYAALAKAMDIEPDLCHIAMFNEEQCQQAIGLIKFGMVILPE